MKGFLIVADKPLCYVSVNLLPNPHANGVQIRDFLIALADKTPVRLIAPFADSATAQRYGDIGIDVHSLPHRRSQKYSQLACALIRAAGRVSAIITRSLNVGLFVSIILRQPVLVELHHPPSPLQLALARHLTAARFQITTISPILAEDLRGVGLNKTEFSPLSTNGWEVPIVPDELASFDCGYIGSDAPGKGIDNTLAAAKACPSLSFLVVGINEARLDDLPENVTGKTRISHDEVVGCIDQCKLLLAPYDNTVFGADGRKEITRSISPLKVFEYLSRGKPVIVSALDSITQQLGDQAPVRYVPTGDIPALTAEIQDLASDRAARTELGQAALQDWQRRFRTSARVEKMLSLCASLARD